MKIVQIVALVLAGVAGGVLYMKWTGKPEQAVTPAAQSAPAAVPETAAQPPAQPEPLTQPAAAAQAPAPAEHKAARKSRPKVAEHTPEAVQAAASPEPAPAASAAPAVQAAQAAPSAQSAQAAAQELAPIPAALANVPPPPPRKVTVPDGTLLQVRTVEALSSDRNHAGDTFTATLEEPLVVEGLVIAERGARLEGRVSEAELAGRVRGVSHLTIELTRLTTSDGQHVAIATEAFAKQGETSRKADAAKIGAAAGIGAAIGAIAGGGKGAGLGAIIGGAAGGGGVAATRGKATTIPSETRLSFRLRDPVTVTEKRRHE